MRRIQSKNIKNGTYELNKTSLSCFDNKRYILDDGVYTLAYFYKDLKNQFFTEEKRFPQILTVNKGFHRFSSVFTNKNKCIWIQIMHTSKKIVKKW